MRTTIERDTHTGAVTVHLAGDLTRTTVPTVRSAIGRAAAQCPTAVLVDLADLERRSPVGLTVFAAVTRQAEQVWGVPVVLYSAAPGLDGAFGPSRSFVALYENRWQALTAMRSRIPRWISRSLTPVPRSAAAARAVTDDACSRWRLSHLRDGARLVASELAANAIVHAATAFDLTAGATRRYLRIAVEDRSRVMPRAAPGEPEVGTSMPPGSGRGLRMVEAISTYWGATRVPGGKIVWALLSTEP
jgi:anti-anti-sigma regulatory factor